jgi:hypothetical protein
LLSLEVKVKGHSRIFSKNTKISSESTINISSLTILSIYKYTNGSNHIIIHTNYIILYAITKKDLLKSLLQQGCWFNTRFQHQKIKTNSWPILLHNKLKITLSLRWNCLLTNFRFIQTKFVQNSKNFQLKFNIFNANWTAILSTKFSRLEIFLDCDWFS